MSTAVNNDISVLLVFCAIERETFAFDKFLLYMALRDVYSARHSGSVAERLKAPVLKTGDPKGF